MGCGVVFYLSALREGTKTEETAEETEGNLDGLPKDF